MNYGDQVIATVTKTTVNNVETTAISGDEYQAIRRKVRNETIDELCLWLESCIAQVDHGSEVYKACTAMVNAMRGKKASDTAHLGTSVGPTGEAVTRHP